MKEVRNNYQIFNFLEGLVVVIDREELGPKFRVGGVDMAQSPEHDLSGVIMLKIFKIFSGPDIPLVIKKDFVATEAEKGFIFIDLLGVMDFSVSIASSFESVGENVVLGFESFIIESHPSSFFVDHVQF